MNVGGNFKAWLRIPLNIPTPITNHVVNLKNHDTRRNLTGMIDYRDTRRPQLPSFPFPRSGYAKREGGKLKD